MTEHGRYPEKIEGRPILSGLCSWKLWLRGMDLNHRPLGYEPNELPGCSTPQIHITSGPEIFKPSRLRFHSGIGRVASRRPNPVQTELQFVLL